MDIVLTGFHCVRESQRDLGLSNSDEPYFVFATTDGRTTRSRRTQVFEEVDTGETTRLGSPTGFSVWGTGNLDEERDVICLVATAMEEDGGDSEKAEATLKSFVAGAVAAGATALGLPGGGLAGALVADITTEMSGLDDDVIGVTGIVLTRDELRRLARTKPRRFGDEGIGYHIVLRFKGGSEGTYFAFLRVEDGEPGESVNRLDAIDIGHSELSARDLGAESILWTAAGLSTNHGLWLSRYQDKAETRAPNGSSKDAYWRWPGSALQASHVVAGSFLEPGDTEYVLYSASDGRYTLVQRGSTGVVGGVSSEGSHRIVRIGDRKLISGATAVVPGTFSDRAADEGLTDVLVYRKDGGRQEFYSMGFSGETRIPDNFKNWRSGWDFIAPVQYPGRRFTSLLLYRADGEAEIWHMNSQGTIARLSSHRFSRDWSFICQAPTPDNGDDVSLFFYSRDRRLGRLVSFPSGARLGNREMPVYDLLAPVRPPTPRPPQAQTVLALREDPQPEVLS